jgi:hypothetical protein
MCCDGCNLKKTLRTVEEAVYGVMYGALRILYQIAELV